MYDADRAQQYRSHRGGTSRTSYLFGVRHGSIAAAAAVAELVDAQPARPWTGSPSKGTGGRSTFRARC